MTSCEPRQDRKVATVAGLLCAEGKLVGLPPKIFRKLLVSPIKISDLQAITLLFLPVSFPQISHRQAWE
jgi:hypothetical protein